MAKAKGHRKPSAAAIRAAKAGLARRKRGRPTKKQAAAAKKWLATLRKAGIKWHGKAAAKKGGKKHGKRGRPKGSKNKKKRGPGRPKGSKNKKKAGRPKGSGKRGRPRKNLVRSRAEALRLIAKHAKGRIGKHSPLAHAYKMICG